MNDIADRIKAVENLFDITLGPVRMAVLEAALEMDVAGALQQSDEVARVAKLLGVRGDHDNLRRFLDALAAMGFVAKRHGRYANTPLAEDLLLPSSPTCLGDLVANLKEMQFRNLDRIPELVRNGPPEVRPEDRTDAEGFWRRSARLLASYQKAGVAELVAGLVEELPEYPHLRRMLDLGGGPGIMCLTTVARHPRLSGVVCDQPAVLDVTREEIAAAGLERRMDTIAGDYNTVDLGSGYDLIWTSHCLYFVTDLDRLFERVLAALEPGGVFMSLHEGLSRERTLPEPVVLSRLSLALEGQDTCFEHGEIAAALHRAGFESVESRDTDLIMGDMELITARKARTRP